jgi:hypothetical protein
MKWLTILTISLLWCHTGLANDTGGIKQVGTDQKCFNLFERENIFKEKFLPKVNKDNGAIVFYIGCNKDYDNWGWWNSTNTDLVKAHQKAYQGCVENQIPKHNLTGVISPSKWAKARKLDKKKYCSDYAKTNTKEDFAESIVCWLAIKYKSDKISENDIIKFKKFVPNSFKLFDEANFIVHPLKIYFESKVT